MNGVSGAPGVREYTPLPYKCGVRDPPGLGNTHHYPINVVSGTPRVREY